MGAGSLSKVIQEPFSVVRVVLIDPSPSVDGSELAGNAPGPDAHRNVVGYM